MKSSRTKKVSRRVICLVTAVLIVMFAGIAVSQRMPPPVKAKAGTVTGTIYLKSISGNLATTLRCYDLYARTVPASPFAAQATGDISSGRCTYSLKPRANEAFVVEVEKP